MHEKPVIANYGRCHDRNGLRNQHRKWPKKWSKFILIFSKRSGCIMTIVQIARQYRIAVIKLHRGQYVYQVPCMYYLYLYLYISLFLSLSIFTFVSVSILNFSSVYSSTYTSIRVPTGNMQQKDCLPPTTTLCRPFSR